MWDTGLRQSASWESVVGRMCNERATPRAAFFCWTNSVFIQILFPTTHALSSTLPASSSSILRQTRSHIFSTNMSKLQTVDENTSKSMSKYKTPRVYCSYTNNASLVIVCVKCYCLKYQQIFIVQVSNERLHLSPCDPPSSWLICSHFTLVHPPWQSYTSHQELLCYTLNTLNTVFTILGTLLTTTCLQSLLSITWTGGAEKIGVNDDICGGDNKCFAVCSTQYWSIKHLFSINTPSSHPSHSTHTLHPVYTTAPVWGGGTPGPGRVVFVLTRETESSTASVTRVNHCKHRHLR